jgi:hypothetical protein
MFREDGLEVQRYKGCLSRLYGMELGNNSIMTFSDHIFHVMGTDDIRGTRDDALEFILLALLVELHGTFELEFIHFNPGQFLDI